MLNVKAGRRIRSRSKLFSTKLSFIGHGFLFSRYFIWKRIPEQIFLFPGHNATLMLSLPSAYALAWKGCHNIMRRKSQVIRNLREDRTKAFVAWFSSTRPRILIDRLWSPLFVVYGSIICILCVYKARSILWSAYVPVQPNITDGCIRRSRAEGFVSDGDGKWMNLCGRQSRPAACSSVFRYMCPLLRNTRAYLWDVEPRARENYNFLSSNSRYIYSADLGLLYSVSSRYS